jgi:hypothetical protein
MLANLSIKPDGFVVGLRDLNPVPRSVFWPETVAQARSATAQAAWTAKLLDGVYAALNRIETELEQEAPVGKIELGSLPPEHVRYFFCREHLKKVDRLARAVEFALDSPRRPASATKLPRAKPVKVVIRQLLGGNPRFERRRDAVQLEHSLADLEREPVDVPDSPLVALLRETALLSALASSPMDVEPALLVFRSFGEEINGSMLLAQWYSNCLSSIWGTSTTGLIDKPGKDERLLRKEELLLRKIFGETVGRTQAIFVKGINVRRFVPAGNSTMLIRTSDGRTGFVLVTLESATTEAAARSRAKQLADSIDALEADSFGPVIHRLIEFKTLTDFRSGVVVPEKPSAEEFRALMLSALPLPPEVTQQLEN